MRIDFFEEFPSPQTLLPIRSFPAGTTVFMGCSTLEEFQLLSRLLRSINPQAQPAWWPILKTSYWVSPFSSHHELLSLKRQMTEVEYGTEILMDLELPLLKLKLVIKNFGYFFRNKELLKKMTQDERVLCAQYPDSLLTTTRVLQLLGVSFPNAQRRLVMAYSSMMPGPLKAHFRKALVLQIRQDPLLSVGIGALGRGALGFESQMSDLELEQDLSFCHSMGVKRVVVFRLGGATPSQIEILREMALHP
jgi:hypothetical protein